MFLDFKSTHDFFIVFFVLIRLNAKQALQDLSVSLVIESGYDNMNAFLHRGIIYAESER